MKALLTFARSSWIVLGVLAVGWSLASPVRAGWNDDTWAQGGLVDVQLSVEGRPATLYLSPHGDDHHYFEARESHSYSITVRNTSAERVGVLIAVDGLNVVSGERTDLSASEAMYVLGPWETTTIDGWRTSLDDVQRFVFVDEQHSYAERTGQANGDMGWIRVLAFRERRAFRQFHPDYRGGRGDRGSLYNERDGRGSAPGASLDRAAPQAHTEAAPPAARSESKDLRESLKPQAEGLSGRTSGESYPGTGWGSHHHDSVREVEFTAEHSPIDQHVFRYEYASGLQALGIFVGRDRLRDREHRDLGFARPPRW